jgi:hypothetical protein
MNNEDNIYNNKSKNIIYITKAQNENFKKFLERKINNDYKTELNNQINNNILKTDEKKKRKKIIYLAYKSHNNLSAEHKKRKALQNKLLFKEAKFYNVLFEKNDLNTGYKNLTSNEKELI